MNSFGTFPIALQPRAPQDAIDRALAQAEAALARAQGDPISLSARDPIVAADILRAEIDGARKEIKELTAQLVPGTSDARESAVESQLDAATDRLEGLQEQLDQLLTGRPVTSTAAPPPPFPGEIPQQAMNLSIWLFLTVGVTIIAIAWARAFSRRPPRPVAPDLSPRLDRIEQAVEAVAIEVERISEGQRFTNKIMGDLRALPAPNAAEAWPASRVREAIPVPRDAGV